MTIDPKDLRTLLVRVTAVTLAVRLVPMIGQDLGVHEAALALGVGDVAHEAWPRLLRGLYRAGGGFGAFLRLLPLLCEVAAPALAVAFARAAGWGAIPGLLAGLILAMAPLGLDAGVRGDGVALVTSAALLALALLRAGLRAGDTRRVVLSALPLLVGAVLEPPLLLIVPGGLLLAARAVAATAVRRAGVVAWLGASALALLLRHTPIGLGIAGDGLPAGWLAALPTTASWWLAGPSMDLSGWGQTPPYLAALQAFAAVLPSGTAGALARQLELQPAAMPAIVVGGLLALAAGVGLWRGRVWPDPVAVTPTAEAGWQTLGVQVSVPRTLGDRDVLPLLLPLLLALAFVAWGAATAQPAGLMGALAVARACALLLLGVGLTALTLPQRRSEPPAVGSRAAWRLAAIALAVFGLGAHHLLVQTQAADRQSARKVARYARESLGHRGALLAIGGRGVPILALLDPYRRAAGFQLTAADPAEALSALTAVLAQKPDALVLVGDRDALGPTGAVAAPDADLTLTWQMLAPTLAASGWQAVEDSHRFLGHTAVVAFVPVAPPPTSGHAP